MAFCSNCGKQIDADKRFCSSCGAPVNGNISEIQYSSQAGYQTMNGNVLKSRNMLMGCSIASLIISISVFFVGLVTVSAYEYGLGYDLSIMKGYTNFFEALKYISSRGIKSNTIFTSFVLLLIPTITWIAAVVLSANSVKNAFSNNETRYYAAAKAYASCGVFTVITDVLFMIMIIIANSNSAISYTLGAGGIIFLILGIILIVFGNLQKNEFV